MDRHSPLLLNPQYRLRLPATPTTHSQPRPPPCFSHGRGAGGDRGGGLRERERPNIVGARAGQLRADALDDAGGSRVGGNLGQQHGRQRRLAFVPHDERRRGGALLRVVAGIRGAEDRRPALRREVSEPPKNNDRILLPSCRSVSGLSPSSRRSLRRSTP